MDLADEILSRVRDAEAQSPTQAPTAAQMESLRVLALEQLALVPEPPSYHRASDPSREKARARLPDAEALLRRALATRKGAAGTPFQAQAEAIATGLEAQVRALAAIAQGQILQGEDNAQRAHAASRAVNELSAAFHRLDATEPPVFNRSTGVSRYDPRPTAQLEVTLPCPNRACRKTAVYALSTHSPHHRFVCGACKQPFQGYFGDVRGVEQMTTARGKKYTLRLDEIGGHEESVTFEDASGGHLPVAPHDLVALIYSASQELIAVENLSTARVLWVQGRDACFLATAAFQPGAQLAVFRAFRDRVLLRSTWGRASVRVYYLLGPPLARRVAPSPTLRALLRTGLRRAMPPLARWR